VEWDQLDFRINGERINELVKPFAAPPIETLRIRFANGLLRVEGTIRKIISVPFTVDVSELRAHGTTVRVPLRGATALGLPVPMLLFRLFKEKLPVAFEEPATLVISLERFLPPNVSASIQRIWIIDGGLAVTLGHGGADLPPAQGE